MAWSEPTNPRSPRRWVNDERDVDVLRRRRAGETYEAIGGVWGVTLERVRQLYLRAREREQRELRLERGPNRHDAIDLMRLAGEYGQMVLDVLAGTAAA